MMPITQPAAAGATLASPYPADLSQANINAWFPMNMAQPAQDTFEIALVLGGTISAGTYTAGVLDYLLEALDKWEAAKRAGVDVPQHKVVIRVITGASGGGINGVIFSRILAYESVRGAKPENPLYQTWTGVLIDDLLQTVSGAPFVSALNTSVIEDMASTMSRWGGTVTHSAKPGPLRPWISDKLRVVCTLGNTTTFPYAIQMQGQSNLTHAMNVMADWIRFVVDVPGGTPDTIRQWAPDEIPLNRNQLNGWDPAAQACLATSAFPIAFPPRQITRDESFAGYRFAILPGDGVAIGAEFRQMIPLWSTLLEGQSRPALQSLNVDGGTCNNEPLDIARRALAGGDGRNPRGGNVARRATILIDPFSNATKLGQTSAPNSLAPAMDIINGLISQARYKPEDLILANDPLCFSRYLVAPVGPGKRPGNGQPNPVKPVIGDAAIACGSLGGFGGFFSKDFLDYDFKLGRKNAESFLRNHFMMPATNNLFSGRWVKAPGAGAPWEAMDIDPANPNGPKVKYYAVIPIMTDVTPEPDPEFLPKIARNALNNIYGQVEKRLDWLYGALKDVIKGLATSNIGKDGVGWWLDAGWKVGGQGAAMEFIKGKIEKSFTDQGLL
jgi:hypothetical protein